MNVVLSPNVRGTAKMNKSRDMQIRLYLHDKSLRGCDWLPRVTLCVIGGHYGSFFVAAAETDKIMACYIFIYSGLCFQYCECRHCVLIITFACRIDRVQTKSTWRHFSLYGCENSNYLESFYSRLHKSIDHGYQ